MKPHRPSSIILFSLMFPLLFCKKPVSATEGKVSFMNAPAQLIRGKAVSKLKIGSSVSEGDVIKTAAGVVVVIFGAVARMEVQPNAIVRVEKFSSTDRALFVEKGNMWLDVSKQDKKSRFKVRTPTSVAGVRGTRFLSFQFGEFSGTCHCEGDVEFSHPDGNYKQTHSKHDVVFFHKGKMLKLHQKHFSDRGVKWRETHDHSMIDDSPVGPKFTSTPEEEKIRGQVLAEKFAALK